MRLARRHKALVAAMGVVALLLTACGNSSTAGDVTVTSFVTAGPDTSGSSSDPAASSPEASASASPAPAPSPTATEPAGGTGQEGVALPSGFVPTKLKEGEKPPQFIVVSFDGVGWHEKWQHWFDVGRQVPFKFTGFLSGTYMLSDETKNAYQGPGHSPGNSSINWNSATDLPIEIRDLNQAIAEGNEIGTHFNGHFCSGAEPSGSVWTTADWNWELDQFFSLIENVRKNNPGVQMDELNLDPATIRGERTPCLEGTAEELFPALIAHDMTYDSSFSETGISWPKKSPQYGIWRLGMPTFPINGTGKRQIMMDYNFWVTQRDAKAGTLEDSAADQAQVLATYNDMYDAAFNGNRAPLILGNHFNQWNNSAYNNALTDFVLARCGQPETYCVPFRDLIAWMDVQDPAVLAQLQALPAEGA